MESKVPRLLFFSSDEVCSTKASIQLPSAASGLSGESSEKSDVGSVGVSGSGQSVSESWLDSDGEQASEDNVAFSFLAAKRKESKRQVQCIYYQKKYIRMLISFYTCLLKICFFY